MEAVELDDLDSIEGILSWRNVKARKYREFPGLPITFDQFFFVVAKDSDAGVLVKDCLYLSSFGVLCVCISAFGFIFVSFNFN